MRAPSAPPDRRGRARLLVLGAPLVFAGALAGLLAGVEPFGSWFFVFAWWSWILGLDGWIHLRRGSSMLLDRPRAFLQLCLISAAFWCFFEVVNLRLANWYYVGLPRGTLSRSLGILVSFATVLPGLLETADLLATFGLGERLRVTGRRWRVDRGRARLVAALGWAFLLLPLAFPRYAYPLIWGATCLLAEPWLARREEPGLWTQLAAGRPAVVLRLLVAGAICGLCWESWNYWASAKWIYTVPFFEELKLFEMPVLGFLGFPAFALEAYTFARLAVALGWIDEWEPGRPERPAPPRRWLGAAALGLGFSLLAVAWIDRHLVRSLRTGLDDFESLSAETRAELEARGVEDVEEAAAELQGEELASFERERRLLETALMGRRGARWLASIDVRSVDELAGCERDELETRLRREGHGPAPPPSPAELRVWHRKARARFERGDSANGPRIRR